MTHLRYLVSFLDLDLHLGILLHESGHILLVFPLVVLHLCLESLDQDQELGLALLTILLSPQGRLGHAPDLMAQDGHLLVQVFVLLHDLVQLDLALEPVLDESVSLDGLPHVFQ